MYPSCWGSFQLFLSALRQFFFCHWKFKVWLAQPIGFWEVVGSTLFFSTRFPPSIAETTPPPQDISGSDSSVVSQPRLVGRWGTKQGPITIVLIQFSQLNSQSGEGHKHPNKEASLNISWGSGKWIYKHAHTGRCWIASFFKCVIP